MMRASACTVHVCRYIAGTFGEQDTWHQINERPYTTRCTGRFRAASCCLGLRMWHFSLIQTLGDESRYNLERSKMLLSIILTISLSARSADKVQGWAIVRHLYSTDTK
jgi:hypothetical protein